MLGFDALGKLALGQLPNIFKNLFFSQWSQPQTKKTNVDSFKGFVFLPVTTPVVFSSFSQPVLLKFTSRDFTNTPQPKAVQNTVFGAFSQPTSKKALLDESVRFFLQPITAVVTIPAVFSSFSQPSKAKANQSELSFRVLRPDAVTPTSLVFTKFSEPIKVTLKNSDVSSSFFVQPAVAAVVVGGDFEDFGVIRTKPVLQQGWSWSFVQAPVVQSYVFSKFEQPISKPSLKEGFINTPAFVPVQSFTFSRFEQPSAKRTLQLDQSFVNLPVVQVIVQPYVFGQFDQPQFKKQFQSDVQFEVQPPQVVVTNPFTGFLDFGVIHSKKATGDFSNTPTFVLTQNYVFTQFSQPQTKKIINDQFTWFSSAVPYQPYVFSLFAQPYNAKLPVDSQFESTLQPTVIVIPPAFTGFNDFSLLQLIGSQRKQDGSSVQFTILPMPQVISVVNFTGFSDFNKLIQTSYRDQSDVLFDVIVIPDDTFLPGGKVPKWPRWGTSRAKKTSLDSSNIKEIIYDQDLNELSVRFQNDRVYNYTNVEDKRVKGLIRAKSSGKYLHNNLKGKYPTTRIK